jgi:hypothetical protein
MTHFSCDRKKNIGFYFPHLSSDLSEIRDRDLHIIMLTFVSFG